MGWYDNIQVQRPDVGSPRDLLLGQAQIGQQLQQALAPLQDIARTQTVASGNQIAMDKANALVRPDMVKGSVNDLLEYKQQLGQAAMWGDKEAQARLADLGNTAMTGWEQAQNQQYRKDSLAQALDIAKAQNAAHIQAAQIGAGATLGAANINRQTQAMLNAYSKGIEMKKFDQEQKSKQDEAFNKAISDMSKPEFMQNLIRNNPTAWYQSNANPKDVAKVGEAIQKLKNAGAITPDTATSLIYGMGTTGGYKAAIDTVSKLTEAPIVDKNGNRVQATNAAGKLLYNLDKTPMYATQDLTEINPIAGKKYDPTFPVDWFNSLFNRSSLR